MSRSHRVRRDRSGEHDGFHKSCKSFVQFSMVRTHLFFKVEVEHDEEESPEKIGEEIGRQLRKLYVVRSVELSSVVTQGDYE